MTPPTPRAPASSDPAAEPLHRAHDAKRRHRRVVAVAFGVSILLHALLVVLYPLLVGSGEGAARSPSARGAEERPEGTELVRIVERPAEELERPDEPETERVPTPAPPRRPAAPLERTGEAGTGEEEGRSAAERVRSATPDARLVLPLSEDVVALTPEQVAQLELSWALEELNDSMATAAEAYRRARDWTYTDDEGRRWGVSSEGLHLGDFTLPLPTFGAPYDPNAWKGSMDADLARAAGSAAARESLDDRAEAIRERKDEERKEKADTTGGGGGGGGNI